MRADPPAPARHGLGDLLRLHGFRHLLLVRLPSSTADGMFQLAAASLLLFSLDVTEATSAVELARILVFTTVPFTLVGPFAGVLIDRWRRQRILASATLTRVAVVAIGVGVARVQPWGDEAFFAAVLLAIALNRLFLTTLGAVLPRVVPGEALVVGNAISSTGGTVFLSIGVGIGGYVAALIGEETGGPEWVIVGAIALYLVSVTAALRLPVRALGPDLEVAPPPIRRELRRAAGELVDGLRRIAGARRAWAPMTVLGVLRLVITTSTIASLLVFRNLYGGGTETVATVLLLFGAGVAGGAVVVATADRAARLRPETALRTSLVLAGIAQLALGPGVRKPALLVLSVLLGLAFGAAKVATDTLVQGALPDGFRGRVFAAYDVATNLAYVAAGVFAAFALPDVSRAEGAIVAAGVATLIAVVVTRPLLTRLPAPVGLQTWELAEHALD